MRPIIPIILAGGYGTRLWPLSRKSYPKQFSKLLKKYTLFQKSVLRVTSSEKIIFEENIILTNSDYRFIVKDQLLAIGVNSSTIILEPERKNTAAAILSASLFAFKKNRNAILLITPSDHLIEDVNSFHECIYKAQIEALKGKIITFGVKPTYPETGYGYIKINSNELNSSENLIKFFEKPSKAEAKKMLKKGNYLWNSGIFLFRAIDMINAFKEHEPDLLHFTQVSIDKSQTDLGFINLYKNTWSSCKNISIDYAIMEKIKNLAVIPLTSNWTDLGNWNSVWKEMKKNTKGVSLSSNAYQLNCQDTLLRSENENQKICGLGLTNIVAIAMPDAVLVANKENMHEVTKIVNLLEKKEIPEAKFSPIDHRPWGMFEVLKNSNNFKLKLITVNPKQSLSLQSHKYRSEHWVVVQGKAMITINDKVKIFKVGESVYIPIGIKHKLANPYLKKLVIVEVQTGSYLEEDDIIRYEDVYRRN